MIKLTQEQAGAIVRLLPNPDFRVFMDILGAKGEESMMQYVNATASRKTKQGKCQAYTEIVDVVATAKKTFDDYSNSK